MNSLTGTILVVEDSARIRPLIARILETAGFRVLLADSSTKAIEILDDRVDLLLTDVVLPGSSGFDLARDARERRPRLVVLYMSGFDLVLPPGMDFIAKPFKPEDLVAKVRNAIKGPDSGECGSNA